jgi:methylthioribulose-1-phosphate dehydratase
LNNAALLANSRLHRDGHAFAQLVRELGAKGYTPATSSNFSFRLDRDCIAITVSGRDKSALTEQDLMVIDLDGRAINSARRSSAETALHLQIYRQLNAGCVLHTHSLKQTLASRLFARQGGLRLQGYELLKAFPGVSTHDLDLLLPIVPNSQHMPDIEQAIAPYLGREGVVPAYLIENHGLYVWGRDMAEAKRAFEAIEFLLDCELELLKFQSH